MRPDPNQPPLKPKPGADGSSKAPVMPARRRGAREPCGSCRRAPLWTPQGSCRPRCAVGGRWVGGAMSVRLGKRAAGRRADGGSDTHSCAPENTRRICATSIPSFSCSCSLSALTLVPGSKSNCAFFPVRAVGLVVGVKGGCAKRRAPWFAVSVCERAGDGALTFYYNLHDYREKERKDHCQLALQVALHWHWQPSKWQLLPYRVPNLQLNGKNSC
jgi:hypothetical protein